MSGHAESQDIGQIEVVANREAHRRALRHAYEEVGVTGVPLFVIGDRALTGLQDRETLEAVIEEALAAGQGG
jgi:predicted DsbA family dithiol-disulfide isomerase